MSRIYGFLGGIIATSSLFYYTSLRFRRDSRIISDQLKESKEVLENIGKPPKYSANALEYTTRDDIGETMKDLWNDEIIRGVNWLYGVQWSALGKKLEDKTTGLFRHEESK